MAWQPPRWTWCIYYDNGTVYTDLDGLPQSSPVGGAVQVVQTHTPGRNFVGHGEPFFLYRTDQRQWWACDTPGLLDQLTNFAHAISCVRVGRWLPAPDWVQVLERSTYDLRGPIG